MRSFHDRRVSISREVSIGPVCAPCVFARLLGLIHRGIGVGNQLFRGGSMRGIERNAQAGSEPEILPFKTERDLCNGAHHTLSQSFGVLFGGIGHQQRKLIAAQAAEYFVAPHQRANFPGDADQHGIARPVAEGVIDVFELVQIEEYQRTLGVVSFRDGEQAGQLILQPAPVKQAGKRVTFGKVN